MNENIAIIFAVVLYGVYHVHLHLYSKCKSQIRIYNN